MEASKLIVESLLPMLEIDLINEWLKELALSAGIPHLKLDAHRLCALKYANKLDFVIELPDNSPLVYMYSPLINLSEVANPLPLYDRILKANFFCLDTRGATFAIDERNNRVILSYGHLIDELDSQKFQRIVGNFLETAFDWLDKLTHAQ
ncbi:MAG TPA: CesT family type III secretion system chaperone [Opitutales bacterium]|nr:CesT family type III secretion system chaperone [Opitutales bacterium]